MVSRLLGVSVVLGLLAIVFHNSPTGRFLAGQWSFSKGAVVDRGYHFRLKVSVDYKGERQDFDIVVACRALIEGFADGSSSRVVGLTPTVYGRRMSDGKGLVVRVPDACHRMATSAGGVPADFMPLMVVYDDADTLAWGTAYASRDAFTNPLSELVFHGASIEASTAEAFDDFRRNGPPNLVRRVSYYSHRSDLFEEEEWPSMGLFCMAYMRLRISDPALRARLRDLWPADRPRFWTPPVQKGTSRLAFGDGPDAFARDDGLARHSVDQFGDLRFLEDAGIPNATGAGTVRGPLGMKPLGDFFPVWVEAKANGLPDDASKHDEYLAGLTRYISAAIDYREGATKGFAYCMPYGPGVMMKYPLDNHISTIDDYEIIGSDGKNHTIGGPQFFFENDEFIYARTITSLESLGDV